MLPVRQIVLLVIVALFFSACTHADHVSQIDMVAARSFLILSDSFLEGGQEQESVKALVGAARLGLPVAQAELALRYAAGEGVTRNLRHAEQLLRTAIADDSRPAYQRDLACVLYQGRKSSGKQKEAADLMRSAAKMGDVLAAAYLSRFYRVGIGVPRKTSSANAWLMIALRRLYVPPQPMHAMAEHQRIWLAAKLASPRCGPIDTLAAVAASALQFQYEKKRKTEAPVNDLSDGAPSQNCLRCSEFVSILLPQNL